MNNKHVLQIIAGFLALFSFLSGWVITENISVVFSPSNFLSNPNHYVPLKIIFLGLPIAGIYNIYCGFTKKSSPLANWGNVVICVYLLIAVKGAVAKSDLLYSVTLGYYMCLLSLIATGINIFTLKRQISGGQKNHTA
ncbi:hypothetical protein [Neobacillus niacini]|uniref:hypothetical protein n=1 Tax=Neobacillus niacini TaxID=86668 RepID=UPI0021CB63AF|nr:hypothetical protein [Neobacillus niacini]MCM3768371.1 hypothetical protein [Neobacillus niacini]